ncbi:hypothetical protein M3629_05255 [Paenibacillus polysaccharolyticus]|uniref:hypothetical protein n=1 Tax=Paenibacillus polysaccharolyticus TaxID=582692 RepID=UPI00203C491D|nr:hypothetical protein [Paenibacillus polysaccharolyticus]MCM3132181.1 hypothetical protein [Paenibacillus polysaccharolyticus]
MTTEVWIPMDEIRDQETIWAGTKIRIYQQQEHPTVYLLSYIYGNSNELQLTCLTHGEAGNIGGVIAKDFSNHYALAQTLKTFLTGVYSEICFE